LTEKFQNRFGNSKLFFTQSRKVCKDAKNSLRLVFPLRLCVRSFSAEREWRMILPVKNANRVNKELYLFNIPSNAITEVVFGCKMQQPDKEKIFRIIKKDKSFSHCKNKRSKIIL
jgi:hypothetical protein